MEVVPEEAISMIKKAKTNYRVSQDTVIISKLNIRRFFSAPSCSYSTGEEQRDINDAAARTAQPDQHQRSVEEPEAASLLFHQMSCLQPPTTRHVCARFCGSQRQILGESGVFTTWHKWEFSFSWFVSTAATHKPIFFTQVIFDITMPYKYLQLVWHMTFQKQEQLCNYGFALYTSSGNHKMYLRWFAVYAILSNTQTSLP